MLLWQQAKHHNRAQAGKQGKNHSSSSEQKPCGPGKAVNNPLSQQPAAASGPGFSLTDVSYPAVPGKVARSRLGFGRLQSPGWRLSLSSAGASWKSPHLSWKDGTGAARTGQPMASGTRGSNCIQNAPVLTCWSFCLERGISTAPNTEKIPNTEKSQEQAPTAKQE